MCCLAICMSSLKKCLFKLSAYFFIIIFNIELHELFINFWRQIYCWSHLFQIFPPILWVFFLFCLVSFAVEKVLSLIRFYLLIFFLISFTLREGSKKKSILL